jgi:hypothetical protein
LGYRDDSKWDHWEEIACIKIYNPCGPRLDFQAI